MNNKPGFPFWLWMVLIPLCVFLTGCPAEDPVQQARKIKFAADHEFLIREDGLPALQEFYGFQFDEVYGMVIGLTHEALRARDVDAALGYATDGKIKELSLVSLEDDKEFFPVYNPAPVIRQEALELFPEVETILNEIASRLDTKTMISLNYLVDLERYEPSRVAMDWLIAEGLISEDWQKPDGESYLVIGSKNFTEQKILGQIAIIALENAGIPVKDYTNLGDTKANRTALLEGKIDMYWEYTGIAWSNFFSEKATDMPDDIYSYIAKKDAEAGLIWLKYAPFNNAYTILMCQERAEELEITTISELVAWIKQVQAENKAQDI